MKQGRARNVHAVAAVAVVFGIVVIAEAEAEAEAIEAIAVTVADGNIADSNRSCPQPQREMVQGIARTERFRLSVRFAQLGRFQLQKVLEDLTPVFRQDAFRMELNSPDGMLLVLHSHDFAFLRLGGDFQAVRQ